MVSCYYRLLSFFPPLFLYFLVIKQVLLICNPGKGDKSVVPWEVRFRVAVGVAEALTFLHTGCSRPIIHRDVKSSNILLSDEFEPQVNFKDMSETLLLEEGALR